MITLKKNEEREVIFLDEDGNELFRVWATDYSHATNIDVVTHEHALNVDNFVLPIQNPSNDGVVKVGSQVNCTYIQWKANEGES